MLAQCAGVPLPAVAVLLSADAAAERGELSLATVIVLGSVAAIAGSVIGYILGRIGGRPLMLKLARRFHIEERRIDDLDSFFARHGSKAVFFGRWVGVVRLWGAIAAGAAHMRVVPFVLWTTIGSILWVSSLSILAAVLGSAAQKIGEYFDLGGWILLPIVVGGFIIAARRRRRRARARAAGMVE